MISKNKRAYDADRLEPQTRLRANVQDLFAGNQLTGKRTQELINDIAAAGNDALGSLRGPVSNHTARNLRRSFLKRNQWPQIYWAQIRVKSLKTDAEELQWCAFLLPHEYIETLARLGSLECLLATEGLDPLSREHLEHCQRRAQCRLVALGLWGDGVPVNWDRTESVETLSLNLPGQAGQYKPLRLPITAVSRKQISENTFDDMMTVIAWSLVKLGAGTRPTARHDDSGWLKSDCRRARAAEKSIALGVRAALVEVRGDWKMFGETFHFPKHNTKDGLCWLCTCTPDEVCLI